ncbi:hypothetical protein JKP88DRAFT_244928 [Tribonema minus]|uniref:Uncharacterized protein n=1 Tax=Tribonema minus TaxID=303371 RepID=A0A835YYP1_9STRA|nr:hypothetical protein JKP88DRAFT_244928 [Tribonema minus]
MWQQELLRCRRETYLILFCTAYTSRTVDPDLPAAVVEFLEQLRPLPQRGQLMAMIDADVDTRFLLSQFQPSFAFAEVYGSMYPPACVADHLVVKLRQRCVYEFDEDGEPYGVHTLQNGYHSDEDEDEMVDDFVTSDDSPCHSPNIVITSSEREENFDFCLPPRLSLLTFFMRGGGSLCRQGAARNSLTVDDTVECVLPRSPGVALKHLLHMSTRSHNSWSATFQDAWRVNRKIFRDKPLALAHALADSSHGQLMLAYHRTPRGHELEATFMAHDGTTTGKLLLNSTDNSLSVSYEHAVAATLKQRTMNIVQKQGIDLSHLVMP